MALFKLEALVDEKHVGNVLRVLDRLVYEPKMIPLREAAVKNGKVRSTAPSFGQAPDLITKEIMKRKLTEVTSKDMRKLLESLGYSPLSFSHFLKGLMEMKVLRRGKTKGIYHVVKS